MDSYSKELECALALAKEAGVIMLKYFDEGQQVEVKADNTHVTIADKMINSLVIKKLQQAFPDDGVIGEEESTSEYGMGRKWFCDPIDGTAAYVRNTPTAMFSLALVIDGKPVMGVAYDPFLDRIYTGIAGEPSRCNGKEIRVSKEDLSTGFLAVSGSLRSFAKSKQFQRLLDDKVRITTFSGAVYKCCLVAKGKLAGYVENGVNAHDMAAAQVIVEGAGGKVTGIDGKPLDYSKPFKGAIASNSIVHDKIVAYCN